MFSFTSKQIQQHRLRDWLKESCMEEEKEVGRGRSHDGGERSNLPPHLLCFFTPHFLPTQSQSSKTLPPLLTTFLASPPPFLPSNFTQPPSTPSQADELRHLNKKITLKLKLGSICLESKCSKRVKRELLGNFRPRPINNGNFWSSSGISHHLV